MMTAKETIGIPMGEAEQIGEALALIPLARVPALQANVEQLGQYVAQMGKLMAAMQRRMDELEARQARVTISHGDVKRIGALIRMRADEICGRYDLRDRDSARIFRAAIKKDILKRYQVKDLHDVPEAMLPAVENQVTRWADIRLVMERRAEA